MSSISDVLADFSSRALEKYQSFYEVADPDWRSLCEMGDPFLFENQEVVRWKPMKREINHDLAGLKNELHPDLRAFYESFWSGGLEASEGNKPVSLIQIWNSEDLIRLKENLVGHLTAKKVMGYPLTGFFACTSPDSDFILSVDTEHGWVVVEKPGYRSKRRIADSLEEFLLELSPADPWNHPERSCLRELWDKNVG